MDKEKQLNALDLFSGAGGMSLGFEQAGVNVVAAIEFDKQIAETYKVNHPNTKLFIDDIKNISTSEISSLFSGSGLKCDIIFGGPPCQGFSMAGRRIRSNCSFLNDERNYLFKEYIRMVEALQPLVFVLENVPGILNYDGGSVKEEIDETFNKLGYKVSSKVLCAADYGVPQLRNRAIFIGTNTGINPDDLFPSPTNSKGNYVTIRDAISDLPEVPASGGSEITSYNSDVQVLTSYQKAMRSPDGKFYNHESSHHKPETLALLSMIKQGQTMKDLPSEYRTKSVHSGAYGRMEYDKPAYTLTTRLNTPSVGRITHPEQNRTITPREAARIQSFPDSYRFVGDITSVGKQIGNAVPPLLARRIAERITSTLR